jgi:FtsP/CotA-like multicopper oxidase with cupredoxin domain
MKAYNINYRCFPKEFMNAFGGGGGGNLTAVPAGIFDGCVASNGSTEVIKAFKLSCKAETWLALDIIGAFNFVTAMVSIDEHPMWVYAMDGDYVTPQKVHTIPVTNGDRYSVLIKLETLGDFNLRVVAVSAPQLITGTAIMAVRAKGQEAEIKPSVPYITDAGVPTSPDVVVFNLAAAKPYPLVSIPKKADAFFKMEMVPGGSSYLWALNRTLFPPQSFENDEPVLFRPDPHAMGNVTITTRYDTWVDLIFEASIVPMPPHPIHKHANKMFMIGAGTGAWNYTSVDEAIATVPQFFNLVDPPRRDAFATPPAFEDKAWMVVRYHVNNPGAWLLHCHIQNHMMGGMSMIIQDGVDKWPAVPLEYLNYV